VTGGDPAAKDALLLRVLEHVPFDGWTAKALAAADPEGVEARRLFPGGVADAVTQFADWADRRMEAALEGTSFEEMRIRDRIALMVRLRLEALEPHRLAVRLEAAYLALHGPDLAARLVWRSADRMWRRAGDTATDFNHYTKRALLSGVIVATTLCWLGDASAERAETWAFLARRIDHVLRAGKALGQAKAFADPSRVLEAAARLAGRVRYGG
jgi:ubiquinone biosynthesis protein COQ9